MREVVLDTKEDRSQVYLPDKCIGCGTCVATCPKGAACNRLSGRNSSGTDGKRLKCRRRECVFCSIAPHICSTWLTCQDQRLGRRRMNPTNTRALVLETLAHFISFFNISKSSSRRSYESLTPTSMPDWSIPSRSATDRKTDCDVSFVLLPGIAANIAVWRMTCPFSGSPSNSNVSIFSRVLRPRDSRHETHAGLKIRISLKREKSNAGLMAQQHCCASQSQQQAA